MLVYLQYRPQDKEDPKERLVLRKPPRPRDCGVQLGCRFPDMGVSMSHITVRSSSWLIICILDGKTSGLRRY